MQVDSGVGPTGRDIRALLEKSVVPLVVSQGQEIIGIGTGTLISSTGVLLLARHVVLEAHERGVDRLREDGTRYRDYNLSVVIRTGTFHENMPDVEIGGLVPVIDVWLSDDLDVGFARIEQKQRVSGGAMLDYDHMGLNLSLPSVGQRVVAFGYQGVHGNLDGNTVAYEDNLFSSDGIVTEVFQERRDSVMLRFPSFHVEGDFKPAMSGGPIFFDGVLGISAIVCSGSSGGYASGAIVWPAMGIPVRWGEVAFPDMLTFARGNYVAVAKGLDRVTVEHLDDDRFSVGFRADNELSSE